MRVVVDRPPLFEEIAAAFPLARGKGIFFAWGPMIYNPSGVALPPQIEAHERAHGERQGGGEEAIRGWWRLYLADPAFRLREEIAGHRAELAALRVRCRDRNQFARQLWHVAGKLASPLYGGMLTTQGAVRALLA